MQKAKPSNFKLSRTRKHFDPYKKALPTIVAYFYTINNFK